MNYHVVKHLRESLHFSQKKLAELSGVSERTIREIENGRNNTPSHQVLEEIARVLCRDNPSSFFDLTKDAPDFAHERNLLESGSSDVDSIMIEPLKKLLHPESENCVSYVFACMAGYLHGGLAHNAYLRQHTRLLLPAFSASMISVTLTTNKSELNSFWSNLIRNIRAIIQRELPDYVVSEGEKVILALQQSRAINNAEARLIAVRTAFYWLEDNWCHLYALPETYYALSDISIVVDHAADDVKIRADLFYSIVSFFRAVAATNPRGSRW